MYYVLIFGILHFPVRDDIIILLIFKGIVSAGTAYGVD